MTEADRELMQRYIYQVTRRLAKDQREETARELEELITDMAEQKGMEEALKEQFEFLTGTSMRMFCRERALFRSTEMDRGVRSR